jgi:hypothetical protein
MSSQLCLFMASGLISESQFTWMYSGDNGSGCESSGVVCRKCGAGHQPSLSVGSPLGTCSPSVHGLKMSRRLHPQETDSFVSSFVSNSQLSLFCER